METPIQVEQVVLDSFKSVSSIDIHTCADLWVKKPGGTYSSVKNVAIVVIKLTFFKSVLYHIFERRGTVNQIETVLFRALPKELTPIIFIE